MHMSNSDGTHIALHASTHDNAFVMRRRLHLEAQALTRGYVEAHGRALTQAVCDSCANQEWREAREPRAPRPVCGELLKALAGAREETLQLIDSSVLQGSASGAPAPSQCFAGSLPLVVFCGPCVMLSEACIIRNLWGSNALPEMSSIGHRSSRGRACLEIQVATCSFV